VTMPMLENAQDALNLIRLGLVDTQVIVQRMLALGALPMPDDAVQLAVSIRIVGEVLDHADATLPKLAQPTYPGSVSRRPAVG